MTPTLLLDGPAAELDGERVNNQAIALAMHGAALHVAVARYQLRSHFPLTPGDTCWHGESDLPSLADHSERACVGMRSQ
jgi:hypothetical protein